MAVATIPFEIVSGEVAYIGGTRVTLETLLHSFLEGATAEEIVQRYPTLDLADVYATIGYYLHNREEIDNYLRQAEVETQQLRDTIEGRFPPIGIRERLLDRKKGHA